jgi:hypothetical protein
MMDAPAVHIAIPSSMFQILYRTIQQLNNVGVKHFHEGNPTEACECFRSALLVFQLLLCNIRSIGGEHADPPEVNLYTNLSSGPMTEAYTTDSAHRGNDSPRGQSCGGDNECFPLNTMKNRIALEGRMECPVPMMVPMFLCEEKLVMARCQYERWCVDSNSNNDEGCPFLAMIIIFNLVATTQMAATKKAIRTARDESLNTALQLYRLVYDCINVSMMRQRDEEGVVSSSRQSGVGKRDEELLSVFQQMLLLCVLHNMGLLFKLLERENGARACHEYIFPVWHYIREGLDSEHSGILNHFNVDVLIDGCIYESNVLKNTVTAPCA